MFKNAVLFIFLLLLLGCATVGAPAEQPTLAPQATSVSHVKEVEEVQIKPTQGHVQVEESEEAAEGELSREDSDETESYDIDLEDIEDAIHSLDNDDIRTCVAAVQAAWLANELSTSFDINNLTVNVELFVTNEDSRAGLFVFDEEILTVHAYIQWRGTGDDLMDELVLDHECSHIEQFSQVYKVLVDAGVDNSEALNLGFESAATYFEPQFLHEIEPWKRSCQKADVLSRSDPNWFNQHFPETTTAGSICRFWQKTYFDTSEDNPDGLFGGHVMLIYLQND